MRSIVQDVWGETAKFATGIISPFTPCHNHDAQGYVYDPGLARQELSQSWYSRAPRFPTLKIDLSNSSMIQMGLAMKEYWKNNLGLELDVLQREPGRSRRQGIPVLAPQPGHVDP